MESSAIIRNKACSSNYGKETAKSKTVRVYTVDVDGDYCTALSCWSLCCYCGCRHQSMLMLLLFMWEFVHVCVCGGSCLSADVSCVMLPRPHHDPTTDVMLCYE